MKLLNSNELSKVSGGWKAIGAIYDMDRTLYSVDGQNPYFELTGEERSDLLRKHVKLERFKVVRVQRKQKTCVNIYKVKLTGAVKKVLEILGDPTPGPRGTKFMLLPPDTAIIRTTLYDRFRFR